MITQTLALLVDGYRELNSKKLFWITMILSVMFVAAFACFGVNSTGISVLGMTIPIPFVNSKTFPPETFYKMGFVNYGVGFWLAWAASILALVSTAPIFPDFLAGGAIELVLSKPIGRLRLFLTKYITGLLFVGLQVGVFTLASFLVIGLRGGVWEFKVFLAIPIVVCFFSYLFSMCALFGILTRSTIASLLLTLLFWFFVFLANSADKITLAFREQIGMELARLPRRIERMEKAAATLLDKQAAEGQETAPPPRTYTKEELDAANPLLPNERRKLEESTSMHQKLVYWNNLLVNVKTVLPKTEETIWVLKRALISDEELKLYKVELENAPRRERRQDGKTDDREKKEPKRDDDRPRESEVGNAVQAALDARSIGWVIGTSLGFEAVVLGFAAWRFRRRDF